MPLVHQLFGIASTVQRWVKVLLLTALSSLAKAARSMEYKAADVAGNTVFLS